MYNKMSSKEKITHNCWTPTCYITDSDLHVFLNLHGFKQIKGGNMRIWSKQCEICQFSHVELKV